MKSLLVVLTALTLFGGPEGIPSNETSLGSSDRSGKFFPIFSIIRFQNNPCAGTGTFIGTCVARRECRDLGGLKTGNCASRRGVCCVIQKVCGSTSNVNNTYFTNVGYPAPFTGSGSCSIIINRCNSDVCQMRINFVDLSLGQPNGDGVCNTDVLTITGAATNIPPICGENAGLHLYLTFDGDNPITITVTTSSTITFRRRWNLMLQQLECNGLLNAPSGCLMYYTGTSGSIKSFNYASSANPALAGTGLQGTRELANLNYGVCVRTEGGYCSIRWTQAADIFSFTVSNDVIGQAAAVGNVNGAQNGAACLRDFVVIGNAIGTTNPAIMADRFCGVGFVPVTTFSQPFVLRVVTSADETNAGAVPPDVANRGFMLNYAQQLC